VTARTLWRAALGALALISLAFVGCDERNDADVPATIYHLQKQMVLPGTALFVDLQGDMLAVAAASAGTYLFNVADPATPSEVFHYTPVASLYAAQTAYDPVTQHIVTINMGAGPGDRFPIHAIPSGQRLGIATVSGAIVDLQFGSTEERLDLWTLDGSGDNDGLVLTSFCYDSLSGEYEFNCVGDRFGYSNADLFMRGFDRKDTLFAIAASDHRVRIHNSRVAFVDPITVNVSGDARDCAWYGNYLLVADNFSLDIIDISDLSAPEEVGRYVIQGADRLQEIDIDGSYAVLLDDADGVYVVDISNPVAPKVVQSISLPEVSRISVDDGMLAIADQQLGVLIYTR